MTGFVCEWSIQMGSELMLLPLCEVFFSLDFNLNELFLTHSVKRLRAHCTFTYKIHTTIGYEKREREKAKPGRNKWPNYGFYDHMGEVYPQFAYVCACIGCVSVFKWSFYFQFKNEIH